MLLGEIRQEIVRVCRELSSAGLVVGTAGNVSVRSGDLPITIVGAEFLLGGDIITVMNGEKMDDPEKFLKVIRSLKVGDKVSISLYHQTKTRNVEFTLPERPILPRDLPPEIPRSSVPVK